MNLRQLLEALGERGVAQAKGSTYHPVKDQLQPITDKSCDQFHDGSSLRDLLMAGLYPLNPEDSRTPLIDLKPPLRPK